jgi:hypothetical protein
MERRRAFITAATISVCLAAAGLAVVTNSGLLSLQDSQTQVGQLLPSDISPLTTEATTSTTSTTQAVPPSTIIRYEDVYVTVGGPQTGSSELPALSDTIAAVPAPVSESQPIATKPRANPAAAAAARPARSGEPEHESNDHQEGDEDDD